MPDREKVIKGLECLAQAKEPTANPCNGCEYINRPNFAFCVKDVAIDTLALLKEQEPIAPSLLVSNGPDDVCSQWYLCGKCKKPIDHKDRFCKRCGQAVKWDE